MHIRNIPFDIIQGDIHAQNTDIVVDQTDAFDETSVRKTIKDALSEAQANNHKSIAFSEMGCDDKNFPYIGLSKSIVQEVLRYVRETKEPSLEKIVFCLGNESAFKAFDKTVRGYVRHVQEDLSWGPYVTVDIIIEIDGGLVIIERSSPPYGWALPGGFLDYGETLEDAARREAKEETNLELEDMRQFHTYSDPRRDMRFQTITTVFAAKGTGKPQSGDDAQNLKIVPLSELMDHDYAFDHKEIIKEYLDGR